MTVWIVADVLSQDGRTWELIGVFDTEDKAVSACQARNHAVWSMPLNIALYEPDQVSPDIRYPLAEANQ